MMGATSDRIGRRPLLAAVALLALLTSYPALSWLVNAPSFGRLMAVELRFAFLFASYTAPSIVFLTEIMRPGIRTAGFSVVHKQRNHFRRFHTRALNLSDPCDRQSCDSGIVAVIRHRLRVDRDRIAEFFMRRATFRWAPMKQPRRSANRIITLSLLFGAQLFSYMIRYALSVTAPTLMQVYHLSPQEMGYVLSGWNWAYTVGVPILGPLVDRFGAWIVMGSGSVVWGLSTIALPLASTAASLFLLRMIFGFAHSMLTPAGASVRV